MSAITGTRTAPRESTLQKHPLTVFFALAFGLTWIFMITDALGSRGILPFRLPLPLMLLEGYMPTAAAVIVAVGTQGGEGVKRLLRKLLIGRVGLGWYAAAILGYAAMCAAAVALYNAVGGGPALPLVSAELSAQPGWQIAVSIPVLFIVSALVNGEELAWRGFALPRLQSRYSALKSSLILGILWTLFHLPLFFTIGGSSQANMSFLSFLIGTVSLSVIFAWLCNNTRGSVLLAYLLHASVNTWTRIFPIDHAGQLVGWSLTAVTALVAILLIVIAGAKNLSRRSERIQER